VDAETGELVQYKDEPLSEHRRQPRAKRAGEP
jgi:hypothetical protein